MVEIGQWIPLLEYRRLPDVCGLYIIRHIASEKEYVGLSKCVRSRLARHVRERRETTYLYRMLNTHGAGAFEVCVYLTGERHELNDLEVLLIAERGSRSPGGMNCTDGGDGTVGWKATPAQKEALRARRLGTKTSEEVKERIRKGGEAYANSLKGVPRTAETRKKIALAQVGRVYGPLGPAHREASAAAKLGAKNPSARAVLAWAPEALTPRIFETGREAAKFFGVTGAAVRVWLKGDFRSKTGWSFCYA